MREFTRRATMQMTLGSFLGLAMSLPAAAEKARTANALKGFRREYDRFHWGAFLDEVGRAAAHKFQLVGENEEYVNEVARLASRLNLLDSYLANALRNGRGARSRTPDFSSLERRTTFEVTLISFEQGDEIPHHDHPRMTGVLACVYGELKVESFEELPMTAGHRDSLLRRIGAPVLKKGSVSTLTSHRANIHHVRAVRPCQVIDIFTPPYNEQSTAQTRWFTVEKVPIQRDAGVFAARASH